jgi:hypothetical protein
MCPVLPALCCVPSPEIRRPSAPERTRSHFGSVWPSPTTPGSPLRARPRPGKPIPRPGPVASATFAFSHPSNFSVNHPVNLITEDLSARGRKRRLQLGRPFASLGGLSQCFVSFRGQTGSGRRSGSRLPDRASPDLFCCGTDLESAFFVRALGQSWSFRQCLGSVFLDCDRIGPTRGPYRPPT